MVIKGTQKGLGILIVCGRSILSGNLESDFGIFIKQIIPKHLADRDGKS